MPRMPSRLPVIRRPSIQVGDQPVQSPSGMMRAPSARRRAVERISAIVMSAVSSVRTPGVLVTVMPRRERRRDVDMVDAVAEIGDQLHLLAGLGDHAGVDLVGDGRHQDVGLADRLDEVALAHRLVFDVEARVEQFAHARLDDAPAAAA